MNYIIIAAGAGQRMVDEGVDRPKPLVELDGRPMIRRLIDIFTADPQCREVRVIINNRMPAVKEYMLSLDIACLKLKILDTPSSMHSLYECAKDMKRGRFIATTVDTVFLPQEFEAYRNAWESAEGCDGCFGITDYIDDEKPLYVSVGDNGFISGFHDSLPQTAHQPFASGGIYGLDLQAALPVLKQCIDTGVSRMRNFQRALIAAGLKIKPYIFKKIVDVDHSGDIPTAKAFLNSL